MNFKIPRQKYSVVLIDSRPERAEPTLHLLKGAGYRPRFFASYQDFVGQMATEPPHIILFHRSDDANPVGPALVELRDRLPETHFLILASAAGLAATWREWGELIYDCILSPPVHPHQLIQAVDRAAERDAYMYRAEELAEKLAGLEVENSAKSETGAGSGGGAAAVGISAESPSPLSAKVDEDEHSAENSVAELREETEQFVAAVMSEVGALRENQDWIAQGAPLPETTRTGMILAGGRDFWSLWRRLEGKTTVDEVVRELVAITSEVVQSAPVVFLKYLPNRRLLVTTAGQGFPAEAWKSLGLDLSQEPDFRVADLRVPERLTGLKEMGQAVAQSDGAWAHPLILRDQVYGLLVVFKEAGGLQRAETEAVLKLAESRAGQLDLHQYLHTIEILDQPTQLMNRATFQARMVAELARARRLLTPVSLVLISLDQHRELIAQYGVEELNTAMRALGKILLPRIRVNDILARVAPEDLGLILPHTPIDGAAVKAERIRRLIGSADFSKLLPRFPRLTISAGVCEYPSCCRDIDDLFSTADDALWQVKGKVGNKVCVATPVKGFVPDFYVGTSR